MKPFAVISSVFLLACMVAIEARPTLAKVSGPLNNRYYQDIDEVTHFNITGCVTDTIDRIGQLRSGKYK
ncbi:hypothetical protein BDF22DRAFT_740715 [Syncephalis plumigaleata]|nr:hypothetical protein BDF22DRAFT_740715 [Syncephalis plumigaleata]